MDFGQWCGRNRRKKFPYEVPASEPSHRHWFTFQIPCFPTRRLPITQKRAKRRIEFNLGVAYATTPEQMQKCVHSIRNFLNEHEGLYNEDMTVTFDSFGASQFEYLCYLLYQNYQLSGIPVAQGRNQFRFAEYNE